MAVIQLTPQVPSLFINGVDFTSNLTEITGNWSNFSLNGLYIITGRLILEDVIGGAQTLDDRYNTNLCRGAKIEFATNGELAPVIGTTYIESSQFDENNGVQTISFTCLLGLHNSKTARDIGTCVSPGSTAPVDQAIQDFLIKSGISLGDISVAGIPGTVFQSTFSEAGGSFISSAGQLAFANGYSLYQDYQGVIRAIPYTPPFRANVFSGLAANTVQWERFQDSTLPPDKVCVTFATAGGSGSGSRRTCTSGTDYGQNNIFDDNGELFESRTDPTQLETIDTTEIDRDNREVNYSQITERDTEVYNAEKEASQSYGGSGGSGRRNSRIVTENQIIEERYETSGGSSSLNPGGGDTINGCYPRDEGRLIFRQTGTYAPASEIFAAYRAAAIQGYGGTVEALKAEGSDDAAAELQSRISIAESDARRLVNLKTETWSYNIPSSNYSAGSTSTAFVDEFLEEGGGNFAPGCDPGEGGFVGYSLGAGSGSGSGNANSAGTVVYESSEIGIIGNLIPFIGDPTFGTGDPTNEDDPKLFVQASLQTIKSRNLQIWSLQGDRQTWKSTSSTWQIGIEANPELVEAKKVEAEEENFTNNAGLQNMLTVARTLRRVAGNDSQDNPPGDPGRIPPEQRVQFQPDKVIVDVVSQYGCPVERTISVALGEFCNSRDTASAVGQAIGLIDWARTKAQLFSVDLASLPDRSLHPLNTFSFVKPNGAVEVYAVDSPTVVYRQNEAIFASTGLFVGLTTANGETASDPSGVNPGFGGSSPVPPLESSGEIITLLPLDENNEVDIANLPSNVVILPPEVPPPDGFIGVVILDGTAPPPAQIPNVVVLGPGSPPPNNVPNLVVLPGVSPPTSTPVWTPDTTVDPPVSPNYTLSNVVADPATPQPCLEVTFCTVQIAPNVGGDLEIFCDDFDDCFLDSTGLGPGSYFDAHPVIIDRFTFSNGNGIILQSVTPAAGSYLNNESQVANACIYPRCDDIFASPPQEDPLVIAP